MKQAGRSKIQKNMQIGRRLREGALILLISLAIYILIALVSYHVNDPGWSYSGQTQQVSNLAGKAGAWLSDILYSLFGYIAYLFPLAVVFIGIAIYQGQEFLNKHQNSYSKSFWLLRIVGLTTALISGCGLTTLHFYYPINPLPMSSGGLLGAAVKMGLVSQLSYLGSTVILLAFFLTGITL
ncbi:MAG TPA: DNA translocase FtsK 4TM domain-containing protein, partial [Gammaproteobacteria bacterium]|nr:DNA translocase FtsK 4TM domain-containing protein [Gammaproteobacteria bacterium]